MALLLWEKDLHKLKAHSKYTIIEKRLKGEGGKRKYNVVL